MINNEENLFDDDLENLQTEGVDDFFARLSTDNTTFSDNAVVKTQLDQELHRIRTEKDRVLVLAGLDDLRTRLGKMNDSISYSMLRTAINNMKISSIVGAAFGGGYGAVIGGALAGPAGVVVGAAGGAVGGALSGATIAPATIIMHLIFIPLTALTHSSSTVKRTELIRYIDELEKKIKKMKLPTREEQELALEAVKFRRKKDIILKQRATVFAISLANQAKDPLLTKMLMHRKQWKLYRSMILKKFGRAGMVAARQSRTKGGI